MRLRQRLAAGVILALAAGAGPAAAGDRAGDFDYYVLALSWSPSWCALTGDDRGDPQCDPGRGLAFILHGLWPQYEQGWPQDCFSPHVDATRAETAAMADIMGGAGLAWHEWKAHGRCSGLSAADYFATARAAFDRVQVPDLFARVDRDLTLPARVIEEAFVEANPDFTAEDMVVTCDQGRIAELRLCLTLDLDPRPCGADVARECRLTGASLPALR